MKTKIFSLFILLLCLLTANYQVVQADGIIIPEPPVEPDYYLRPMTQLEIRYHHVTVTIDNQIATIHVDQVFYNPNDWEVEGIYVFPIPNEAVVKEFVLWMDGEPVKGEVLEAKEARQIYEDIVAELKDPALLEYAGQNALTASIYPIPPGGERRIELEYSQALKAEDGLVRFDYPLNTEKFSVEPLDQVKLSVDIKSTEDIRGVYSPSHTIDLDRIRDDHVFVSYEESGVLPDKDFTIYYSIGETQAFHLFTYRDPESTLDDDGYFMMLLAPAIEENDKNISKDLILVLDRSGSMEGEKFRQANEALHYILNHLNPDDRFYLSAFSSRIDAYENYLVSAKEASQALDWLDRLSAVGSTDINRALLEAVAVVDEERPTYLIFLTDGLPTKGEINPEKILQNFELNSSENLRLFPFGVGYDVDTYLLDSLSKSQHGKSTYVTGSDNLGEMLSAFYEKISTPVLTNLGLDYGKMTVFDIYPAHYPDLFKGSQVIITGRYRKGGLADIELSGEINGELVRFDYEDQVFAKDSREDFNALDEIPRLWATRKIGYLLEQIRLYGPDDETIQQIVYLSVRYGIVTEYTSYLVTEPDALGGEAQNRVADDLFEEMEMAPEEPAFGQRAVEKAAGEGELYSADMAPDSSQVVPEADQRTVRQVGARSFVYSAGIWIDTQFDPDRMKTEKVVFLSLDYFKLSEYREDVSAALALGENVILVVDGQAIEIVSEGQEVNSFSVPEKEQGNSDPVREEDNKNEIDDKEDIRVDIDRNKDLAAIILYGGLGLAIILGALLFTFIRLTRE
ncbi:MAG: VWA domain-containing protein [Anaerolineaceae bacterium]|nr:VWA domain-containing protein [Anaerolineaceae bacterium]